MSSKALLLLLMWLSRLSSFRLGPVPPRRNLLPLPRCQLLERGQSATRGQVRQGRCTAAMTGDGISHDVRDKMARVIFMLGGPASGKGTQCQKLCDEFGMRHLSAGELLREEQALGSENGRLIDSVIKDGKIVPVQITLDLLKRAITLGSSSSINRYLIDGFPRNWDNLRGWEESMKDVCRVEAVVFIDCPEQELERRLLSRGLTSGRSDDNLATARKRFETFYESTMPIVKYYEEGNLLIRVRGDTTVDEVYGQLRGALLPLLYRKNTKS